MTVEVYQDYTIKIVGLSHYIYRPSNVWSGSVVDRCGLMSDGYAQSTAPARRWIFGDKGNTSG